MVSQSSDYLGTAFTVSIDAMETTTGISAFERAQTIKRSWQKTLVPKTSARPDMFSRSATKKGRAAPGGHTEACVDLAKLAGLYPPRVICEIMNEDGTMARLPQLKKFAVEHGLKIASIADLINYRRRYEKLVRRVESVRMPSWYGDFTAVAYESLLDKQCHIAMVKGDIASLDSVLVRVHSECLTGTSSIPAL